MPSNAAAAAERAVDAQKLIAEMQDELARRRYAHRRPAPSFVPAESADALELRARFADRYAELLKQAAAEVRAIGSFKSADELVDMLAGVRAMQLLRQEVDPNWRELQQRYDVAEKARQRREALAKAHYPELVADAVLSGSDEHGRPLRDTDASRWMCSAWAGAKRLFVLCGQVGTGKTMAACLAAANERDVLYACARELYRLSDRREEDRELLLDRAETCAVLICDQVGDADEREEDSARLSGLLQRRFDAKRRTILIANLTRKQLEEKYSAAVSSRLFEAGALHTCSTIERAGELKRQETARKSAEEKQ